MTIQSTRRQPLAGLLLAAVAGICIAEWRPVAINAVCIAATTIALVSLWRPRRFIIYGLVTASFFALHAVQITDSPGRELAEEIGSQTRPVVASGEVITEPKVSGNYATFLLRLDAIELGGKREACHATVRARWKGEAELGDEIRLASLAETIPPERNPGVFDMRVYLARRDVYNSFFARYPDDGVIVRPHAGNFILRLAAKSRVWMQATLTRGLEDSPDVGALISGMALGLRHETRDDIEEPFQQTGTLHLFAVAGLHIGIIAQLLWLLGRLVQLPRRTAAAVIIPFLFFYSAITGLHISSLRAATMAAILLGGIFFDRPVLALNSLAAAALVILAVDPNELFHSGFQLSFAVVGAIIVLQNAIFRPLFRLGKTDPFLPRSLVSNRRRILEAGYYWFARGVSISAAAWIGSAALIAWYFYLFTPISLAANLAVVPLAFCILAVAMLSLLAASFSIWLSVVFNNANWVLSRLVLALVHLFSQLPDGHIYVEHPHWPNDARAEITVLDAGAGAAVHVRASGRDWLFDCGSARDFERLVRDYLHSRGVNRIDGLLLSHGDSLHVGGAPAVLAEFDPRIVIDNAAPDRSRTHHSLVVRQTRRQFVARGDSFVIAPNVNAKVLHPPRNFKGRVADDEALVVRLNIAGRYRVLFVSDGGIKTEEMLLAQPDELHSDILIKGQHLSDESGSERFLEAVNPKLIVATSVDFPARERISDAWAEQVHARGIKLFRQDETGAVKLEFFDDGFRATPFIGHEIFRSSSR